MRLTPQDADKLLLHQAGVLAQKRLARGLRLNHPEAVALIATQLLELIRDGHSVAELMGIGKRFLGRRNVLPGVPELVTEVQVEGTFPDGSKLVTVHQPICDEHGELELALYGSFLPAPDPALFSRAAVENSDSNAHELLRSVRAESRTPAWSSKSNGPDSARPSTPLGENGSGSPQFAESAVIPGEYFIDDGTIELNAGTVAEEFTVTNRGDRPIQVGSHYPFVETNAALDFDRARAKGKRLDIPSGTASRFEPGETRTVRLIPVRST